MEHRNAEILRAIADGKNVQWKSLGSKIWNDLLSAKAIVGLIEGNIHFEYRIKPEPIKGWYRVALMKAENGEHYTTTAEPNNDIDCSEEGTQTQEGFVRWLTDRIEYEV